MATLNDVKKLASSGKKKEAAQALQKVLRENPSADAWYYASTLTPKDDAKKKYLQKALTMNPRHAPSKKLMKQLGGDTGGSDQKKKRSGGSSRGALIGVIVVLLIAVLGLAGFFIFSSMNNTPDEQVDNSGTESEVIAETGNNTVSDEAATGDNAAPVGEVAGGPLVNHFQTSGLIAGALDTTTGSGAQQEIELSLNGQDMPAVLRIYSSVDELIENRGVLFEETRGETIMVTNQNAVLFYPASVDSVSAERLRETMRTLPLN